MRETLTIEIIPPPDSRDDYLTARDADWLTREEAMAECNIYQPRDGKRRAGNKPMQRAFKKFKHKRMIAYDLETTNIKEGTPTVRYLTAYCGVVNASVGRKNVTLSEVKISCAIRGNTRGEALSDYLSTLETNLLIPDYKNCRFIAWNGNKYDALLTAQALLLSDNWEVHPFLTKSKSLRGMRVIGRNEKAGLEFEFLDGMAMTGLDTVGMPLKKFLKLFAPDYAKLDFDFDKQEFDPDNPEHVAYAERDSEGLWHAMQAVNDKMIKLTGNELQATMGRAAINYLVSQMPEGKQVWRPHTEAFDIIHDRAKRGGYVWIAKQYKGKVWKYDLNQAYAGAMRDCELPCGSMVGVHEYQDGQPGVYRCTIQRQNSSAIPFYYKDADTGAANFTSGARVTTWILSTEIDHLLMDDWEVEIDEGYAWSDSFNFADMVNNLERERFSDPDGPGGPYGIVIKTLGNSSYGKTLERLDGISLVLAKQCPDGYVKYAQMGDDPVYAKDEGQSFAPYHQPQIGAFITAHVRIQVREAALAMPEHFIYADTDCVVFSAPATHLDIDPRRYGAWKAETEGVEYCFIGKKVYFGADGSRHAKGLRIRDVSDAEFNAWYAGDVPKQKQLQRVNFLKMVAGQDMFRYLERAGTDVRKLKTVRFDGQNFFPISEKST